MKQNYLVLNILKYIDENLYTVTSINELSNMFHYNKDYIMRVFRRELNITIIEYIQIKKISISLKYLENTQNSILKVSLLSGFNSQEYFTEIFRKVIGVSPRIYRKFCNYDVNITWFDIKNIQENLILLKKRLDVIDKYKIPIVPKKSMSLSIFNKEKKTL